MQTPTGEAYFGLQRMAVLSFSMLAVFAITLALTPVLFWLGQRVTAVAVLCAIVGGVVILYFELVALVQGRFVDRWRRVVGIVLFCGNLGAELGLLLVANLQGVF